MTDFALSANARSMGLLEFFGVSRPRDPKPAEAHPKTADVELPHSLKTRIQGSLAATLARVPLFSGAPEALRAGLPERLRPLFFAEGDWIFERSEAVGLYLVQKGSVELRTGEPSPAVFTIADGGFFGEDALLVGHSSVARARALTACDLYLLAREDWISFLELYPSFSTRLKLLPGRKSERPDRRVSEQLPARVQGLKAEAKSSAVILTWGEARYASGYQILRSDASGRWDVVAAVETREYVDASPPPGRRRYLVRAFNKSGLGEVSEEAQI